MSKDFSELIRTSDVLPGMANEHVTAVISGVLRRHADIKREGRVTEDDFVRFASALRDNDYRRSLISQSCFALFDTNNDGKLDASEFATFARVCANMTPDEAATVLAKHDTNKDNHISVEELNAMFTRR